MYSVGPPMAVGSLCAQILAYYFVEGLARELEFDQGAHRHTADLDSSSDVEISVDISTRCWEPSAYAVSRGYGETLWSRELGRGRREEEGGRVLLYRQHAYLSKPNNNSTFPNLTRHVPSQNGHLSLPFLYRVT